MTTPNDAMPNESGTMKFLNTPTFPEIPDDIIQAAFKVQRWFENKCISRWKVAGCADRFTMDDLERELIAAQNQLKYFGELHSKEANELSTKLDACHAELAEVRAGLVEAERSGMERAAKVCEDMQKAGSYFEAEWLAKAIRAAINAAGTT